MTSLDDPRESLMWEKDLIVTSEELTSYAANYPPMGVYIPRGRVKVPHVRSRRTQQISQSARGKPNSPNLLMIRPNSQTTSNTLPPIDVYANRLYDVTTTCHQPTTSSRKNQELNNNKPGIKPNVMKGKAFDAMTSQLFYPNNDVTNPMLDYAKSFMTNNRSFPGQSTEPVLPPPYINSRLDCVNGFTSRQHTTDMTSLMTQDMGLPLGHQYYQHLSAIAAMAWSDCNQATEKLRRLYEETAHLSRKYDPFGLFPGGIPGYHPHLIPASPAPGNTASTMTSKDPRAELLRYQRLSRDQVNQTQNKYANLATTFQNTHCDVKMTKNSCNMTSQSPLPGIALF
uniref:uncharacterized protein LOC120327127 n=1 Tax=Styela clava TaxID=7725 RepID=UPI001939CC4C|nr:uncharacterized protein LOC120327127 [Styela clava]